MPKTAVIKKVPKDFVGSDLDNDGWQTAVPIKIKSNWNGQRAPKNRRFEARMLWSDTALYVKFDASQGEPLVVNKFPKLDSKTDKLWERDVCELFIAPDRSDPNSYFEFEIAPSGEWLDLQIRHESGERVTNGDFDSGIKTVTRITYDLLTMVFTFEWQPLGATPKAGDIWLGNLFRCVGKGSNRGYLAWSATRTKEPDFHVPERFGEFEFIE